MVTSQGPALPALTPSVHPCPWPHVRHGGHLVHCTAQHALGGDAGDGPHTAPPRPAVLEEGQKLAGPVVLGQHPPLVACRCVMVTGSSQCNRAAWWGVRDAGAQDQAAEHSRRRQKVQLAAQVSQQGNCNSRLYRPTVPARPRGTHFLLQRQGRAEHCAARMSAARTHLAGRPPCGAPRQRGSRRGTAWRWGCTWQGRLALWQT
jgi:hypothetical protein